MARPRLRVIDGLRAIAEEAAIEDTVRRAEARQHVRHLRLLAHQLPLFDPAVFQRLLIREADSYARKFEGDEAA